MFAVYRYKNKNIDMDTVRIVLTTEDDGGGSVLLLIGGFGFGVEDDFLFLLVPFIFIF
jgi:hypothetical protein